MRIKYAMLFSGLFFFSKNVFAQYSGPIMDSLKKYQALIESAKNNNEKIKYALQLQKIVNGKSSIDTAAIKHLPVNKAEALKERERQVAEINKLKQKIDTSRSRKNQYANIQKMQAKNDSIIKAYKDAGKHPVIQPGLITLPNADQLTVDQFAHVDTSQVIVSFTYHRTGHNANGDDEASFTGSSSTATMYRQNGIITIRATNNQLPEYVSKGMMHTVAMVNHHDFTGGASSSAGETVGASNEKFEFAFTYNPMSNLYAVGAGAGIIWTTHTEDKRLVIDTGSLGFSAANDPSEMKMPGIEKIENTGGKVAQFVKTKTGFTVNYSQSQDGVAEQFSADIDLTPTIFEAFIEPGDNNIYQRWLPQGPVLTNYPTLINEGKGNDIQVKITLWDKVNNKEAAENYKAVIRLNNVSKMPGYCMNFPQDDKEADDKPDMRFDKADKAIYSSWKENEVETKLNYGPQYATVISYDYGGFADVTADIITSTGLKVKAHIRNSKSDTFTLPRRSNKSLVADYWKEQQNAVDKDDMADDEEIEIHDDRYPGDGLTIYEEYRGFLENRKHFRGNAEKKDLFACNKIGTPRSQDGINMCEAVLNQYGNRVYMHSKFKDDEFGKKHDPDAGEFTQMNGEGVTTAMKYDRCINYNSIQNLHLTDQHGIVLMNSEKESGYAIAVPKIEKPALKLGPPKNMYFLVITKSFSPKPGAWAGIRGNIDEDGHITVTPQGTFKILTDEYAVTVAHEMLHCYHVYHHGDYNDFGQCTFRLGIISGKWIATRENGKEMTIHLFWESDPENEIGLNDVDLVTSLQWHIVGENSTHSGVEDCIMRYDNAHGFTRSDWKNVYLIRSEKNYAELTGINICNSTIGTGVNNRQHKPMSRYGNAAPGVGDCIHQFCVSDKYD